MKIENYKKMGDLLNSKKILEKLRRIFSVPYPHLFLKKIIFYTDNDDICFCSLDENTQEELKTAIKDVVNKRLEEINTEIENL